MLHTCESRILQPMLVVYVCVVLAKDADVDADADVQVNGL